MAGRDKCRRCGRLEWEIGVGARVWGKIAVSRVALWWWVQLAN